MVVTCRPLTADNGITQERIAWPSTWTVHAPHSAMPHPNLVPGRPATSRTAHNSGILGSASRVIGLPLRTNEVDMTASAGTPLILQIFRATRKVSSVHVLYGVWPRIGHFHERLK